MRCVGHCEIDKYADRSYRAIHDVKEDEWYAADIKMCIRDSPYTIEQNHLIRSHKIKLTDILAYLYRRECRQEADSPYILSLIHI